VHGLKRIVFRADGNNSTGLGHLYRCIALAKMLGDSFGAAFVTGENAFTEILPDDAERLVIPATIETAEEPAWLAAALDPAADIIVLDGYDFGGTYQQQIRERGFKLVVIDDLAEGRFCANMVVNHSPSARESDYVCESGTRLALGTDYAMLRPEFLNAAGSTRNEKLRKAIFLCFGGADPLNFTGRFFSILSQRKNIDEIHVVAGAASSANVKLTGSGDPRLNLHSNLDAAGLKNVMEACRWAVVPTSTILFEVCCVKMPVLTGFYAENQRKAYEGFLREKAVIGAGDLRKVSDNELHQKTETLLSADEDMFVSRQAKLIDGQQAKRFRTLFNLL
jgi:UDP-2,4-diacetamido-2,4,6-trideoxy-beta-L-altropyranose hydrolase